MREACPLRESLTVENDIRTFGNGTVWDKAIPDRCMTCILTALRSDLATRPRRRYINKELKGVDTEELTAHLGLWVFGDSKRTIIEDTAEDRNDETITAVETTFYCRNEERAY